MPGETQPGEAREVGVLDVDGKHVQVSLRIAHDGVEYIGHLWFTGDSVPRGAVDHAALPGRTTQEVVERTRRLTGPELEKRFKRALRERRRYDSLRRVTLDMLGKVRRLNQVAIALQAGLVDEVAGADQLTETEAELHEMVALLRETAGVEDESL